MEVLNVNSKKLFPEEKEFKKRLLEFLDKKGFYIVLILCISIIGATAVFVTTHNITSSNTGSGVGNIIPEDASQNVVSNAGDTGAVQPSANTAAGTSSKPKMAANNPAVVKKSATQKSVDKNTASQPDNKSSLATDKSTVDKTTAAKKDASAQTQKMALPVSGEVITGYSEDKLVYSQTLEDWETHSGIDIASSRGTAVKAAADGVVSEVKDDPRLGVIVIIDHQNGLKTVYANLASDDMVFPNQKIKQGDVIGAVGATANFESAEQTHLHFEVWKNDVPVNPATYLPTILPKQ